MHADVDRMQWQRDCQFMGVCMYGEWSTCAYYALQDKHHTYS